VIIDSIWLLAHYQYKQLLIVEGRSHELYARKPSRFLAVCDCNNVTIQTMYCNVTLRRDRAAIVVMEKLKVLHILSVCL